MPQLCPSLARAKTTQKQRNKAGIGLLCLPFHLYSSSTHCCPGGEGTNCSREALSFLFPCRQGDCRCSPSTLFYKVHTSGFPQEDILPGRSPQGDIQKASAASHMSELSKAEPHLCEFLCDPGILKKNFFLNLLWLHAAHDHSCCLVGTKTGQESPLWWIFWTWMRHIKYRD